MTEIILASSSPYRRALLDKLRINYRHISPDIDEQPLDKESATELVMRLSEQKASVIADTCRSSWVIGSDQVACFNHQILGKPHTHENAVAQLRLFSGQSVTFYTAVSLINRAAKFSETRLVPFTVYFRELNVQQIERYLMADKPYDCAGSFKCEGLGIALFEKMEGDDPNSLIGLPLIELVSMLNLAGIETL